MIDSVQILLITVDTKVVPTFHAISFHFYLRCMRFLQYKIGEKQTKFLVITENQQLIIKHQYCQLLIILKSIINYDTFFFILSTKFCSGQNIRLATECLWFRKVITFQILIFISTYLIKWNFRLSHPRIPLIV